MKPYAKNAVNMPRSGIRVILDLAINIPDVIHLEIGQPNFPTPAHIIEGANQAAKNGFTGYTPNQGYASLRKLLAVKLANDNQIHVDEKQIVVTAGGMGGLYSSIAAILEPGDEALLPDPGYPNYEMMCILHGIGMKRYPLDQQKGFLPDLDKLDSLVSDKTKAIIINSPSNPTGAVIPKSIMKGLVEFAEKHDLFILSDESYEKIMYDEEHVSPATLTDPDRVLSIFSFSKTYSMTGWRVGYVATNKELAPILTKMQEVTVSCSPSISQKAAEVALQGSQDCVSEMVKVYKHRRDVCVNILKQQGLYTYTPQGAFYALVDIHKTGLDSFTFAKRLLTEEKVAVAPGATFGSKSEGFVRVSFCTDDKVLEEGLNRICEYVHKIS